MLAFKDGRNETFHLLLGSMICYGQHRARDPLGSRAAGAPFGGRPAVLASPPA